MFRASPRYESVRQIVLLLACCILLSSGVVSGAGDGTDTVDGLTIDGPDGLVDDLLDGLDSEGEASDHESADETEEDDGETADLEGVTDLDASSSNGDAEDDSVVGLVINSSDRLDDGVYYPNDTDGVRELADGSDTLADLHANTSPSSGTSSGLLDTTATPLRTGLETTTSLRFAGGIESGFSLGPGSTTTLHVDLDNRTLAQVGLGASNSIDDAENRGERDSNESTPTGDTGGEDRAPSDRGDARSSINAGLVGALGLSALAGGTAAAGGGASATAAGSPALLGRLLSLLGQFGSVLVSLLTSKLPLSVLRYSRYDDSDPLEHETRRSIYESIEADPGQYPAAIESGTDASLSTVRHHLDVLEAESLIVAEKRNGKRRFYPVACEHRELAAAMDEPARTRVIEALAADGPMTNGELADRLDRDPSTITHHVVALADDELLTRTRDGRTMVNALAPGVEAAYRERFETRPDVQSTNGPSPVGVGGAD